MKLLREKEVAIQIGMSVHWLRRKRITGGGIPYIKMGENGAIRYESGAIEAFTEQYRRKSTSE